MFNPFINTEGKDVLEKSHGLVASFNLVLGEFVVTDEYRKHFRLRRFMMFVFWHPFIKRYELSVRRDGKNRASKISGSAHLLSL